MKNRVLSTEQMVLCMRLLYLVFAGAIFITNSYMPIYLRDFSFISDFMIGMIMSAGFLLTSTAQLIFGSVADRSKSKNSVLTFAQAGYAIGLVFLIFPKHNSLLTLLPATFLFYVFFAIPGLLTDTIVVENVQGAGIPFGSVKGFASVGASATAFIVFLISLFVDLTASIALFIALVCVTLAMMPTRFLPITKGHAYDKQEKDNVSFRDILHNRRLVLLLAFLLLLFIGIQATNTFLAIYYTSDDGLNAGLGMLGLFLVVCIGLEAILMLYGKRFLQEINIYTILMIIGIAAFTRSLIFFLAPNIYVIQLGAVSHALIFGAMWFRVPPYINEIVSKELRATGQAAMYIMVFGMGPMIGSALGGIIADIVGIRNLFGIITAMLFVVTAVFFFIFKHQRILEHKNETELLR